MSSLNWNAKEFIQFMNDKESSSFITFKNKLRSFLKESSPFLNTKEFKPFTQIVKYKCRWGSYCINSYCLYVHPKEYNYENFPYYESNIRCLNESEETACRLKCSSKRGKYCPFKHCSHQHMQHMSILCTKQDCQKHCPSCI